MSSGKGGDLKGSLKNLDEDLKEGNLYLYAVFRLLAIGTTTEQNAQREWLNLFKVFSGEEVTVQDIKTSPFNPMKYRREAIKTKTL